jgi:hypothetical protein
MAGGLTGETCHGHRLWTTFGGNPVESAPSRAGGRHRVFSVIGKGDFCLLRTSGSWGEIFVRCVLSTLWAERQHTRLGSGARRSPPLLRRAMSSRVGRVRTGFLGAARGEGQASTGGELGVAGAPRPRARPVSGAGHAVSPRRNWVAACTCTIASRFVGSAPTSRRPTSSST